MGSFGGTIYSSGLENTTTSIQNCTFLDNSAEFEGGALYFRNNFILTNCTFKNNSITYIITSNPMKTTLYGGAIYCKDKSYSSIENCVFDNNSINCNFLQEDLNDLSYYGCYVYTYGGSIYFYSNQISIDNCIFYKNSLYSIIPNNLSAGNYGAAFLISADDTKLNNCIFENNLNYLYSKYGAHSSYSGASYFIGENFTLSNCKYISNSLHIDCLSIWSIGGAVTCLNNGNSSIYNCYFKNNSIYKEGGGAAIYLERSFLSLNQSTFVENKFSNESLSSSYGAIYTSFVSIKMNNCYFINNECCNCSALYAYITPEHQTIINNCVFEFNKLVDNYNGLMIPFLWLNEFFSGLFHLIFTNNMFINSIQTCVFGTFSFSSCTLYSVMENNCIFPYDENLPQYNRFTFYDEISHEKLNFNQIFATVCIIKSSPFTNSNYFTESSIFTDSNFFTKSSPFTDSSFFSNALNSNDFIFSNSNHFNFLKTEQFSDLFIPIEKGSNGLNMKAIIGIIVGCSLAVIILTISISIFLYFKFKKQPTKETSANEFQSEDDIDINELNFGL